ncbi:MAG TPA: oligosaccharide flippase family protein [Polyangiales bacterium]|nr:oligosaccharide flippase family protein [Polyangiales bacterium]
MSSQPASNESPPQRSLKALALRSASWAVLGRMLGQGLRLLSNIILARLLFPEAFGLTAIVGVFIYGLIMFSDLGIGPSIVYNKQGEEPHFLNTAWTIQILRGAIIAIGAAMLAWPVAEIYQQPELVGLLAAAGSGSFIQGFESTALHTQQRKLELGPVIRLEIMGQVVTIVVMVVWALLSPTVWALVGGSLAGTAAKAALSHVYLPRFPHRLHWDREAAREVYRFGSWIFLSSMFTFIAVQGDRLLLGYYLSMTMLGVYSVATRFTEALTNLQIGLTHSVLFPVFSETARSDRDLLTERYYRVRLWTDLVFLTSAGLLCTAGHVLIDLLYDDRYQEAGWILQALSIQVSMSAFLTPGETLLFSLGKTYYAFARSFGRAMWIVIGIPVTWHFGGLNGVVWWVAFSEVPVLIVTWTGLIKNKLLRPMFELRGLLIWGAAAFLGFMLEALLP